MSDFRCEWQALHGPRCSHQCNECKDNDTPPEPRMTSERQETEQAFERWYNHAFATRGVDTKHMNDCEDAFEAGRTLALRATPRAGSASKERGFFEWSCGCSLNNGLVTPCATHASPAAAPREHPSPEPYCASCDAREGEPCPHNVIQCARPRRAHPPRAVPDETRERDTCDECERVNVALHTALCGECMAFPGCGEACNTATCDCCHDDATTDDLIAEIGVKLATPRAETDETREAVAWGIWHYNGDLVGLKRTKDEAERWCEGSATYGPPRPLYAHPPRAGEVTEEQPFGDYDAGEAHKLALYFAQMEGARGSLGRGYLNLAALGRPS